MVGRHNSVSWKNSWARRQEARVDLYTLSGTHVPPLGLSFLIYRIRGLSPMASMGPRGLDVSGFHFLGRRVKMAL